MAPHPPCQQRLSEKPRSAHQPGYNEIPQHPNTPDSYSLTPLVLESQDLYPRCSWSWVPLYTRADPPFLKCHWRSHREPGHPPLSDSNETRLPLPAGLESEEGPSGESSGLSPLSSVRRPPLPTMVPGHMKNSNKAFLPQNRKPSLPPLPGINRNGAPSVPSLARAVSGKAS